MQKFLEKIQEANAYSSMAGGLGLAKTICRRKLMEASIGKESDLVLSIIVEINALIEFAENKIKNSPVS